MVTLLEDVHEGPRRRAIVTFGALGVPSPLFNLSSKGMQNGAAPLLEGLALSHLTDMQWSIVTLHSLVLFMASHQHVVGPLNE